MKKMFQPESRYAYEKAVDRLDAYVQTHPSAQFRLAYRRLKSIVRAIALDDFPGVGRDVALSYVWQDVDMAFRSHAEPSLSGPVLQMWSNVGEHTAAFKKAIREAFEAADAATPEDVLRRFCRQDREAPLSSGANFHFDPIVPTSGALTEAFAEDEGEDYEICRLALEEMVSASENCGPKKAKIPAAPTVERKKPGRKKKEVAETQPATSASPKVEEEVKVTAKPTTSGYSPVRSTEETNNVIPFRPRQRE